VLFKSPGNFSSIFYTGSLHKQPTQLGSSRFKVQC